MLETSKSHGNKKICIMLNYVWSSIICLGAIIYIVIEDDPIRVESALLLYTLLLTLYIYNQTKYYKQ